LKKRLEISIFILFLLTGKAASQQDSIVWISGNVIDSETSAPVPYANIASYTRHIIFAADSLGHFYIELPRHDSIKIIVIGYDMKVFKLDSMITNDAEEMTFRINRGSIMLNNVEQIEMNPLRDDYLMPTSATINETGEQIDLNQLLFVYENSTPHFRSINNANCLVHLS